MGEEFRAKVFKAGNSLALRLPAGLGFAAGTVMALRVEENGFSFGPAATGRRKFNIDKVAGSATNLVPLDPASRVFADPEQGDGQQ